MRSVASRLIKTKQRLGLWSLILAFCAFTVSRQAYAWPPTYGSEYNFSNNKTEKALAVRWANLNGHGGEWQKPGAEENEAAAAFAKKVKVLCGEECSIREWDSKWNAKNYYVSFKDENGKEIYSFNISVDPGVVEIQTQPETLEQLKKNEQLAQKYIFDVAASDAVGLVSKGHEAGAHFNIGILSAFENNPKAFLKFFVNYHNLPELSSGILGINYNNAPPLSHLSESQRWALSKIVDDANAGKIKTVQEAVVRIRKEVYTDTPKFKEGPEHYQAVGMKYIDESVTAENDRPFELRGMRQPKNAHERTLLAELMEMRMRYEIEDNGPIAFLDVPKEVEYEVGELANRFRLYIKEMENLGATWERFKGLADPFYSSMSEDAFLKGSVDWSSKRDLEVVKSYTRYLASSPWVRQRMKALLESPEAMKSGKVPQIIGTAQKALGPKANAEARQIVENFIGELDVYPQFFPDLNYKASCVYKNFSGNIKGLLKAKTHP